MLEFQLTAMTGADDNTKKAKVLQQMVGDYQKLLFPGIEPEQDSWEKRAKEMLAKEATRVLLVKPKRGGDSVQRALKSDNPTVRKMAAHGVQKEQEALGRMRGVKRATYRRRKVGKVEDL